MLFVTYSPSSITFMCISLFYSVSWFPIGNTIFLSSLFEDLLPFSYLPPRCLLLTLFAWPICLAPPACCIHYFLPFSLSVLNFLRLFIDYCAGEHSRQNHDTPRALFGLRKTDWSVKPPVQFQRSLWTDCLKCYVLVSWSVSIDISYSVRVCVWTYTQDLRCPYGTNVTLIHFRFSRCWTFRLWSSDLWRHVALVTVNNISNNIICSFNLKVAEFPPLRWEK
jgi:hypothetical protein